VQLISTVPVAVRVFQRAATRLVNTCQLHGAGGERQEKTAAPLPAGG
jgi:hypothetical protein